MFHLNQVSLDSKEYCCHIVFHMHRFIAIGGPIICHNLSAIIFLRELSDITE